MPKICYVERKFSAASEALIEQANAIIDEYQRQGFSLTLRQVYYQFVSRGLLANKQTEYSRLGSVINDGRLAGLIDWDAIEDRTRYVRGLTHWSSPQSIINASARSYYRARWDDQDTAVEVWIEKDALVGVIEPTCETYDVPYLSCRGYTSQTAMWSGAWRLLDRARNNQRTLVLHFGDHDPSGIDMSRDIEDRIRLFLAYEGEEDAFEIKRIALNMDQVRKYKPPPNPAKFTDSRAAGYVAQYGRQSWELDALEPRAIAALIKGEIEDVIDLDKWQAVEEREAEERKSLTATAARWPEVVKYLGKKGKK